MTDGTFVCESCEQKFTVRAEILSRYPGWKPRVCMPCKNRQKGPAPAVKAKPKRRAGSKKRKPAEENLPRAQVLEKYTEGPFDGVFTDGACSGNPGPGGWGVVWVENNEILAERHGHETRTTNNRMELQALIEAYDLLPRDAEVTIWSDSNLCVRTINEWAAGWKQRGWKRKTGPVENLELVQAAYDGSLRHPKVRLRWIKAHNGSRWNEYADALATAFLRQEA